MGRPQFVLKDYGSWGLGGFKGLEFRDLRVKVVFGLGLCRRLETPRRAKLPREVASKIVGAPSFGFRVWSLRFGV